MITNLKTMKSMSRCTRMAAAAVMMTILAITAKAESRLQIFFHGYPNTVYTLTINGKTIEGLELPVKKVDNATADRGEVVFYKSACKQISFDNDGKYVVIITMKYTNPINGKVSTYQAEQPVLLEDGDEVFLQTAPKGLSDMKIKEIDSKSAKKNLDSGKYQRLSDAKYIAK